MVKLNELPPEIVDVITEHSYDVKYIDVEQNYPHLLSFAVLSPAFRRASQDLLNRKVFISTRRAASLWLEERLECPVKELYVEVCPGMREGMGFRCGGSFELVALRWIRWFRMEAITMLRSCGRGNRSESSAIHRSLVADLRLQSSRSSS